MLAPGVEYAQKLPIAGQMPTFRLPKVSVIFASHLYPIPFPAPFAPVRYENMEPTSAWKGASQDGIMFAVVDVVVVGVIVGFASGALVDDDLKMMLPIPMPAPKPMAAITTAASTSRITRLVFMIF